MALGPKYWVYYPIADYKEPISSMAWLADKLGIKRCTLTEYKRRHTCIGTFGKAYVIDYRFSKDEIEEIHAKVVKKIERDEEWAPIGDHEYYVSTYGRVKSFKTKKEKFVSQCVRSGALSVTLRLKINNNKPVSYYVHRLVAEAFLIKKELTKITDDIKNYAIIHLNGKKFDNSVSNLLCADRKDLGDLGFTNGLNKPVIKLDYRTGEELDYYDSMSDAARENTTSAQQISMCILGKVDSTGGYKWILDPMVI